MVFISDPTQKVWKIRKNEEGKSVVTLVDRRKILQIKIFTRKIVWSCLI